MKFVVVGGGTGSFTVLRGLKKYTNDITAIVSMFDSGGSTGKLRDEFGILPTGDLRRCLVALAPDTSIVRKLFTYRFKDDCSIHGHSLGNLFLTALTDLTGSEAEAIKESAKILNIKGKVLPVTTDNSNLCAELENGNIVKGETNIDIPKHDGNLKIKKVFLDPRAFAFSETIEAIKEADVIIIGPGDLYTSVIPNLLVEGVPKTIQESKAKKIFVCNIMTKHGETDGFKVSDFANEIMKYMNCAPDYVLCNNKKVSDELLKKYEEQKSYQVEVDENTNNAYKLISEELIKEPDLIRHDKDKLAKEIMKLT